MATEDREAFFARVRPFFAPSTLLDVDLAYTFAKFAHRAQVRNEKDEDGHSVRYFEHVRRVAILTVDELKVVLPEIVISALLHDGIEDTRDITPEQLEHSFGADVAVIVKTLSKVPKEGYLERFVISTDWRPYAIKACDRLDNLRSMSQSSIEFRTKQVRETREKYFPLFDRMINLAPRELQDRVASLRDTLRQETERQATLLEIQR